MVKIVKKDKNRKMCKENDDNRKNLRKEIEFVKNDEMRIKKKG